MKNQQEIDKILKDIEQAARRLSQPRHARQLAGAH
jgi:hypothetical protein